MNYDPLKHQIEKEMLREDNSKMNYGVFKVEDREYKKYWIEDFRGEMIQEIKNDVKNIHFFNGDIIDLEDYSVVKSKILDGGKIPGILVLTKNKTYGKLQPKTKKQRNAKTKHLYKFIPNDSKLPYFLVPYELSIGFNKRFVDKYAVIELKHWNECDAHPIGSLFQVIGEVNIDENIYEYLLWCNDLVYTNKDLKYIVSRKFKEKSKEDYIEEIIRTYKLEDRRNRNAGSEGKNSKFNIYSIDPYGCRDIDDAYSLKIVDDETKLLSIYISNVSIWLDVLQIWECFTKTQSVSTIYLPERKIPMLPTILSETLCSLLEKETRIAFTMDLYIKADIIEEVQWKNTIIEVKENLDYEDSMYLKSTEYTSLIRLCQSLNQKYNYLVDGIQNSHEVVEYLMILMNCEAGKLCSKLNVGIFKIMSLNNAEQENYQLSNVLKNTMHHLTLPKEVRKFKQIWNSVGSVYCTKSLLNHSSFRDLTKGSLSHDMIGSESYLQITSPIRRIVDLLNMTIIQEKLGLLKKISQTTIEMNMDQSEVRKGVYYDLTDKESMKRINKETKHIRHVQNECALIHRSHTTPDLLDTIHDGYIIDRNLHKHYLNYVVYIPSLKLCKTITIDTHTVGQEDKYKLDLPMYKAMRFKIYLFNDYASMKKKWLLNII
jgi:exoribonuclease R